MRRELIKMIWQVKEKADPIFGAATVIDVSVGGLLLVRPSFARPLLLLSGPAFLIDATATFMIVGYWTLRYSLRKPNRVWEVVLSRQECRALGEWLKNGNADAYLDRIRCKYRYAVSRADLDTLSDLNFDAFQGSAFEVSMKKIRLRNAAFVKHHPKSFMLMIDPIDRKDVIGYSCMLPLTANGADEYLAGKISDANLDGSFVSRPNEVPSAILAFAIHLKTDYSLAKVGASRKYALYFWSCIRLHLLDLYPELYAGGKMPILYTQTAEPSLERKLKRIGFIQTDNLSGDGYRIWKLSLSST